MPTEPPARGGKRKRKLAAEQGAFGGLAWLLGDTLTVDEFRERHFERQPLHVQRPAAAAGGSYYGPLGRGLASPESLFALLESGDMPVYRVNVFRCVDGSTKETPEPPPRRGADVRRLFDEGWSLQWLQPQHEHDGLAKLVSVLESEFGSLVGVNAYLTPPGVQGLAPHWDDVEVFVLQLSGVKSWHLHSSTTEVSLPPEAQTLPRFSSGDLSLRSLSPPMMQPLLAAGDLLYFPRGVIHHAPNPDGSTPSVHLTISAFQRQTLFDAAGKTFEEAMSRIWEADESVRRALPWGALSPGAQSYPSVCSGLAKLLRRLADEVEAEADRAAAAQGPMTRAGNVAAALGELDADFVKNRMPPFQPDAEAGAILSPTSCVAVVDPSAMVLLPAPGADDGAMKLLHCIGNSRYDHMMNHPDSEVQEPAPGDGATASKGEGFAEEGGESEPGEGSEQEDSDEDGDRGVAISPHAAAVLQRLCAESARTPLTLGRRGRRGAPPAGGPLEVALRDARVPEKEWREVCGTLTQLAALGLVAVHKPAAPASAAAARRKKTRR